MLYVFSTSRFNRISSRHPREEPSWQYSQDIPWSIMAIPQALLLHADCIASFWTGNSGEYKHISLEGSSSIKLGQNSKQAPFDMILYAAMLCEESESTRAKY